MNAKNDDHTISLHLLPTTSLENVNHINFGVSQEANIDVSQYTNMEGEGGGALWASRTRVTSKVSVVVIARV